MSLDERFFLTCEDAAFEWLKRPALQTLFALLNRDGEEVRVVGGAVRNALLGEAVSDIDCATTAEPSLVMNRAQEAGIRVLPTGLDHGTVTLLIETVAYEVTTLRADIETDGRRARVAFGRDWQLDAMRRDFTMNALYLDRQGRLYDPTGLGLADAKTRYIRFIGDADKRIAEDYLRVLRFFRFHAQYGGQCDGPDYHACIAAQGHLSQLSRERVGTEIVKLLKGRYAVTALEAMHQGGLLPALLGGVAHVSRFARLVSLSSQLHLDPDVTLLLTALLVEHREDAVRIAGRLRLANRQRDAMARLGEGVRTVTSISEMDLQKLAYRYGKDAAVNLVLLALTKRQIDPDLTALSMMLRNLDLWQLPVFPVTGRDLLDCGMAPGPGIGDCLARLEQAWVASGFTLPKEQLLRVKRLPPQAC